MIPRIVLSLERPTLQKQLKKRLEENSEMIVDVLTGRERLWERLKREICDVVVVSFSRIPQPATEMIELLDEVPDAPSVVVILDKDDPELRARLLVSGCQAVLETSISTKQMSDVLVTVIEQHAKSAKQRLATAGIISQPQLRDFVSHSPVMQAFLDVVQRVVNSDCSVLILGETGVGKDRLARAIHNEGPRSNGPFMAINCGALPETLLESELFGHEEGSFTGALRSRRGCFELGHGGTVFLDEIGEMPQHLQVKLLRVLQDHEIRRLGGERSLTIDVRVMAATSRDLERGVAENSFRRDLYYRLNVMTLTLPPLRERKEDIRELALNYVNYLRPRIGCGVYGINDESINALINYSWPGNVRELINVIERALLLCPGENITQNELPVSISRTEGAMIPAAAFLPIKGEGDHLPEEWLNLPWRDVRKAVISHVERAYFEGLLERTKGRIGESAKCAGMEPRSLFEKMRAHGLNKEDFRPNRKE
ncbi:MAG: sigma-54 dependent transcriptional regulator [Pseudomonadota bacterium]